MNPPHPDLSVRIPQRDAYSEPHRPALVGLVVVGAFVGALTLWSTLAPVSGAAIANGNLQVEGKRQTVQHPYGGVVKSLNVHEGERVRKGQVLITLFDSEPRAKLDVLIADRDATLAQEARLIAERDGRDAPEFDPDLLARKNTPGAAQAMANERAIMATRKRQFDTEREVLERKIGQLHDQIGGTQAQAEGLKIQHDLLAEETRGAEKLLESGFTPKTRVLALHRDLAKLEADRGARLADVAGMQQEIAQTNLQIAKLERSRLTEITDQLRTTQSKLAELKPKLDAARDVVERTEIRAPATGAVVGLSVFTEGGVIQPGAHLLDIVPSGNPLMVEARLPLSDVDEVSPGQEADVRLTSINYVERPRLTGKVTTVSADRLDDEKTGQAYYSVQVALDAAAVKQSHIELQAGMPVEVVVPTRPRTLLQYLVGPLRDEITGAFRER